MTDLRHIAHELRIVAQLAVRAWRRRDGSVAAHDPQAFRSMLEPWLAALPASDLAEHRFVDLPATRPPWFDTGIDLDAGDTVTWLAGGRVYLSKLLDIWVEPSFQLWCRIGSEGPVFRGTRATHTFTAARAGRLWLASYFPGEWADAAGRLATPAQEYAKVSGGMSVLLLRWAHDTDVPGLLRGAARDTGTPDLVLAESRRLEQPAVVPEHWDYLWYLGGGEIYQPALAADGRRSICCRTHGDVGILRKEARMPLEPDTRLRWSWRVDQLPVDLPEDTLPSHDYLSIAVEFDDGQDITYYWSSSLPVGRVYRCPLPTWKDKETHVVVRSGAAELGQWLGEERDLFEDYRRIIGGPARAVVRVWLIANSLFQRGEGRCEYAHIALSGRGGSVEIL